MSEFVLHVPQDPDPPEGTDLYGLPRDPEAALVHVLPVSFDATASYKKGAARGPEIILRESHQLDLWDQDFGDALRQGVHLWPIEGEVLRLNARAGRAAAVIHALRGEPVETPYYRRRRRFVNAACARVNAFVHRWVLARIDEGHLCGLLGGDHGVSHGSLAAFAERYPGLGVLHIDAHADLRPAYEGFTYSHASVLGNALREGPGIERLVQVGIRDVASEEIDLIRQSAGRIVPFGDRWLAETRLRGIPFAEVVPRILEPLPELVYVSFDIDGLEPGLCPGTGTPVPGGLDLDQVALLLRELVRSGRTILGFDLVEVSPFPADDGRWDGAVGARALAKLVGALVASRNSGRRQSGTDLGL